VKDFSNFFPFERSEGIPSISNSQWLVFGLRRPRPATTIVERLLLLAEPHQIASS